MMLIFPQKMQCRQGLGRFVFQQLVTEIARTQFLSLPAHRTDPKTIGSSDPIAREK
jgi:hypothetical protein